MAYVVARHKVVDYSKWKQFFDSAYDMRKNGGEQSVRIFRTADDPNNLLLFMEWESIESAQKYIQSEDLQKAMQEASVIGQPDIYLLNEA